MAKCGARTRKGTPCERDAMPNGKCYLHGGPTPRGPALPQFKHGRYSKSMPARLSDAYQRAVGDPELLVLREDIALVEARVEDLLARVDTGESGALWTQAIKTFAEFKAYNAQKKLDKATIALHQLDALLSQGAADYTAWREVGEMLEQRRRLIDSERRRLVDLRATITAEQAMTMLAAVSDIIKRHVTNPAELTGIASDLERLVAHRPAGLLEPPDG